MHYTVVRCFRWWALLLLLPLTIHIGNALAEQKKLDNIKPLLLMSSKYNEYWLQYFLFEDGSYLTTQFSIINFPFNKHKAIMLSTLITPDGKRYVIQNGRGRSDWTFDPDSLNITFSRDINHNIQGRFPDYSLRVHNTVAEAELKLKSSLPVLNHDVLTIGKGKKMAASIYAPHFEAEGKWRLGEEAGAPPNGPWIDFSKGEGFGLHVLMDGSIDQFMNNWIRVFGLKDKDNERIILSSILQSDGERNSQLILHDGNAVTATFRNIQVDVTEEQKAGKKTFPKVVTLKAKNGPDTLEGTIRFTKKLQHFSLKDHVTTLERLVLSGFPTFTRYHYVADYDLSYTTSQGRRKITGKAMSEFTQIDAAKKPKKKRRRKH